MAKEPLRLLTTAQILDCLDIVRRFIPASPHGFVIQARITKILWDELLDRLPRIDDDTTDAQSTRRNSCGF